MSAAENADSAELLIEMCNVNKICIVYDSLWHLSSIYIDYILVQVSKWSKITFMYQISGEDLCATDRTVWTTHALRVVGAWSVLRSWSISQLFVMWSPIMCSCIQKFKKRFIYFCISCMIINFTIYFKSGFMICQFCKGEFLIANQAGTWTFCSSASDCFRLSCPNTDYLQSYFTLVVQQ